MRLVLFVMLLGAAGFARAREPSPSKEVAAEMLKAMHLLDRSFGIESMPPVRNESPPKTSACIDCAGTNCAGSLSAPTPVSTQKNMSRR